MGTPHERVHARYQVDLTVTMKWRRNAATLKLLDASDGGVFVITDDQPSMRELVRLEFKLPGRAEPLAAHGMAVNNALDNDPEGRPPGVGIQFYGMDRDTQRAWGQFIEQLRRTQAPLPKVMPVAPRSAPMLPQAPAQKPALVVPQAPAQKPALVVPQAPAQKPVEKPALVVPQKPAPKPPVAQPPPEEPAQPSLELEIASEDDLYEFYMRDVAAGGMFILTDVPLPEGSRLTLVVRHPIADDDFEVEAVVRAACESDDGHGIEVEFVGLDDDRLDALRDFIDADLGEPEPDAPAPEAPAPASVAHVGPHGGPLAQLFDPWTGSHEQLWSRPPPEDEFDMMFDALGADAVSSVRPSMPSPANEDVPDFLMAIPSWSKLENPLLDPSRPLSIDLEPSDLVEVSEEPSPLARAQRRPMSRAR